MIRGETQYNNISRFVNEIPRNLMEMNQIVKEQVEMKPRQTRQSQVKNAFKAKAFEPKQFIVKSEEGLDYGIGDTVKHIKFGVGLVEDILEGGRDYEVTVNFDTYGTKKMFAGFAKLKKL